MAHHPHSPTASPLIRVEKEPARSSRSSRHAPCILIVDGDANSRKFICEVICSWHCVAFMAASGHEALDILDHRPVDVVLCDVMMPGGDGAETLRDIKQRAPALPVIMMSAMMTPGLRRDLCAMGAQSCLANPMGRKELAVALFPWCFRAGKSS